jgi:hypothetical protein
MFQDPFAKNRSSDLETLLSGLSIPSSLSYNVAVNSIAHMFYSMHYGGVGIGALGSLDNFLFDDNANFQAIVTPETCNVVIPFLKLLDTTWSQGMDAAFAPAPPFEYVEPFIRMGLESKSSEMRDWSALVAGRYGPEAKDVAPLLVEKLFLLREDVNHSLYERKLRWAIYQMGVEIDGLDLKNLRSSEISSLEESKTDIAFRSKVQRTPEDYIQAKKVAIAAHRLSAVLGSQELSLPDKSKRIDQVISVLINSSPRVIAEIIPALQKSSQLEHSIVATVTKLMKLLDDVPIVAEPNEEQKATVLNLLKRLSVKYTPSWWNGAENPCDKFDSLIANILTDVLVSNFDKANHIAAALLGKIGPAAFDSVDSLYALLLKGCEKANLVSHLPWTIFQIEGASEKLGQALKAICSNSKACLYTKNAARELLQTRYN